VVEKICTPAGLRAAPDREDLQAFVEAVSSLDGNEVARLLQERMVSWGRAWLGWAGRRV
jgi:hypothetical protein